MTNFKEIILWIQSRLSMIFTDVSINKQLLVIFKHSENEFFFSAFLALLISGLLIFNIKIIINGTRLGFFKSKLKLGLSLSLLFLILMVFNLSIILTLLSLAKALNLLLLVFLVSTVSIVQIIGEGRGTALLMNNGPGQGSSFGQPSGSAQASNFGQPYGSAQASNFGPRNYAPSVSYLWNYALGKNSRTTSSEPLVDASLNSFLKRNPSSWAPLVVSGSESKGFDGSVKSLLNPISDTNIISDKYKYEWPYTTAEQEANTDLKTSIIEKFINTLRGNRKLSFWARATSERHIANCKAERDYLHAEWSSKVYAAKGDLSDLRSLEHLELDAQNRIQLLLTMTTNSREYLLDISSSTFGDINEAKLVIHREYINLLEKWTAERARLHLNLQNLNLNQFNEPNYIAISNSLNANLREGNEVIKGLETDWEHINNLLNEMSVFDRSKAKSWIKSVRGGSEGFYIVERDREHQSLIQVKAELLVLEDKISQHEKKRNVIANKLADKKFSLLIRKPLWAEEERIVSELLILNTTRSEYINFIKSKK